MILFDLFRRDKLARFVLTLRQEGLRSALRKTARYLRARMSGSGLSSLLRLGGGRPGQAGKYLEPIWMELAEKQAFHLPEAPAVHLKQRKIAMIGDMNLPQCRKYRVEQPAELWQRAGVGYDYAHYEDVQRAASLLQEATHVMLYRLSNTPAATMLLYEARRLRLPVLYDLDDPLFSISAYGTYQNMEALPLAQKQHFLREAPRYLDVMNAADLITVSTPGMITHTSLYSPRPVLLRRNFADTATLQAGAAARAKITAPHTDPSRAFRVGFASGSMGHEVDFATIAQDVIAFLDAGEDRQLVILGHFNKKLLPKALRSRVEMHPFTSYDTYLETLASLDIAVMPLADDAFNRCKSAVRVIDAAAVGVASVVGPVSDMAHQVEDGQTGRVVPAGVSWRAVLEDLAADRAGCGSLGVAAREQLETRWSARCDLPVMDPALLAWVKH